MSFKDIKIYNLLFIIILIIQTVLLWFHLDSKAVLTAEEAYSYYLANSKSDYFLSDNGSLKSSLANRWLDGKFFNDYICPDKDNCFNYLNINKNIIENTCQPLYYYFLHTICSFFPNHFSKWYGLGFNLFLFIITQILLFNVSKKVVKKNRLAFFICFLYGFSAAAVDNFTYISFIALLTVFCLLLIKVFIKCLEGNFSFIKFMEIFLMTIIGCLTHYLFLLYLIIILITFIIIKRRDKKLILCISASAIFGIICSYLVFPETADYIISYIYSYGVVSGVNSLIPNIGAFSFIIRKFLGIPFPYYLYVGSLLFIYSCVILLKYYIEKQLNNLNKEVLYLTFIPPLISVMIISFCINHNNIEGFSFKYYLCFYPLVAVFIISVFYNIKNMTFLILLLILTMIFPINRTCFVLKDFNNQYTSVEKILKNNRVVFCLNENEYDFGILTNFTLCREVYLNVCDNNKPNIEEILLNSSDKTYFVVKNDMCLDNLNKYKILSGFLSNNRINVYKIN